MKDHDLLVRIEEHLDGFPERQREIHEIRSLLFGNVKMNEKGMKEKVDEMHELLVQAQGWKKLGYSILLIAGVIAAIKGWILK